MPPSGSIAKSPLGFLPKGLKLLLAHSIFNTIKVISIIAFRKYNFHLHKLQYRSYPQE